MSASRRASHDFLRLLFLCGGRADTASLRRSISFVGLHAGPGWRMSLHRLRVRKLIHRTVLREDFLLRLTPAGFDLIAVASQREAAPPAPKGMVFFVSYDIPTVMDHLRTLFRKELREQGWRRLHKSLWIAERDLRAPALEASERLGVRRFLFIGTGILQDATRGARDAGAAARVSKDALGIAEDARSGNLSRAYERWVALTDRLREPAAVASLEVESRRLWWGATRELRQSLKARLADSGHSSEPDGAL